MKQHPIPTQNTNTSSSTPSTSTSARARGGQPEGLPVRMITRQQLAAHVGLSVRMIDELTHTGVLPYFKIGKAVRYDLAEAEAAFRARYHVAAREAAPAGAGASSNTTNYHEKAAPAASSSSFTTLNPAA